MLSAVLAFTGIVLLGPGIALAQAQKGPPPTTSRAAMTSKESAALREQARGFLAAHDLAATARIVDRTRGVIIPTERAAWWLIESELEYSQKHYAKSALAAMQIVIHQPKSEQVGPALYWAARCYEELGRPAKAIELYRECLAAKMPQRTNAIRDAATSRLQELNKKAP